MIKKPKIIEYPKIGKEKLKDAFERTESFNRKEQAYLSLSIPKSKKEFDLKTIQVGNRRKRKTVAINLETINFLLKISKNKNNSLTHTHIIKKNIFGKLQKFSSLPSIKDIETIFSLKSNIKYKLIVSINSKGESLGYTVLKLENLKRMNYTEFKNTLKKFELQVLLSKQKLTREKYILFLEKMGVKIYFTPMPGCKLDSNYNFIKN